jgi:GMP synthase-like glutamine amidotransferase
MRHILVIDPAIKKAETDSFNKLVSLSPLPLTYHLPALFGLQPLETLPSEPVGIIILGSGSSILDKLPWQKPLNNWVIARIHKGIPLFGICYGHQMVASLFGGTVEFLQASKEKVRGFREITLMENPLWGAQKTGPLFVSHREIVPHCPKGMRIIAKSGLPIIEGLCHEKFPVWTLQAHPEATASWEENALDSKQLEFGWNILRAFMARSAHAA